MRRSVLEYGRTVPRDNSDGSFFGLVPVGDGGTYGFAGLVSDRIQDPAQAPA